MLSLLSTLWLQGEVQEDLLQTMLVVAVAQEAS
jgi:hypothetical protein